MELFKVYLNAIQKNSPIAVAVESNKNNFKEYSIFYDGYCNNFDLR